MEANALSAGFQGEETEGNITLRNQLESPLLRLPAEIRNAIYSYVGLSTIIKAIQPEGSLTCSFHLPEQLETCKQIRHEATSIVYRSALFDFTQCHSGAWMNDSCDHGIGELVTSIKIRGSLACRITHYLRMGKDPRRLQFPTKWLLNVEGIYIESAPWMQQWGATTRTALKMLCKKDTLEVIFV